MPILLHMDTQDDAIRDVPQAWLDSLAQGEADLAAGRLVDGTAIKRRLRQTISDMQAAATPDTSEVEAPFKLR